ncbi:hypothetical protein E3O45_10125 [Cryobacterium sp. TMS1-20-1]|uniref:hypothetical protein n=1 Tax=Cryobacterium sp. TMS1-20-1 TaxID=1259223 RepID=UPI00106A1687|nr:hypothetical protein [Cryobacterium sp. TMS1-20-1]TFC74544.1 hypothetical protein E3O45_10125 [Cryobacterium sp. TMS1-20-1]
MTDAHDTTGVAAFNSKVPPPICTECELPMEEVMHGRIHEWACVRDTCPKRFHPTFEELIDPDLLIVMGRPDCYRCHPRHGACREPRAL